MPITIIFNCTCGEKETLSFKTFKDETVWPLKMHVVGSDMVIKCKNCYKLWLKDNLKEGDVCS